MSEWQEHRPQTATGIFLSSTMELENDSVSRVWGMDGHAARLSMAQAYLPWTGNLSSDNRLSLQSQDYSQTLTGS